MASLHTTFHSETERRSSTHTLSQRWNGLTGTRPWARSSDGSASHETGGSQPQIWPKSEHNQHIPGWFKAPEVSSIYLASPELRRNHGRPWFPIDLKRNPEPPSKEERHDEESNKEKAWASEHGQGWRPEQKRPATEVIEQKTRRLGWRFCGETLERNFISLSCFFFQSEATKFSVILQGFCFYVYFALLVMKEKKSNIVDVGG